MIYPKEKNMASSSGHSSWDINISGVRELIFFAKKVTDPAPSLPTPIPCYVYCARLCVEIFFLPCCHRNSIRLVHIKRNLTFPTKRGSPSMLGKYTVDRRNPAPVEVGSLSHYLQGFINPFGGADFFHQQYQSHGIHLCLQVGHTFRFIPCCEAAAKMRILHEVSFGAVKLDANRKVILRNFPKNRCMNVSW